METRRQEGRGVEWICGQDAYVLVGVVVCLPHCIDSDSPSTMFKKRAANRPNVRQREVENDEKRDDERGSEDEDDLRVDKAA